MNDAVETCFMRIRLAGCRPVVRQRDQNSYSRPRRCETGLILTASAAWNSDVAWQEKHKKEDVDNAETQLPSPDITPLRAKPAPASSSQNPAAEQGEEDARTSDEEVEPVDLHESACETTEIENEPCETTKSQPCKTTESQACKTTENQPDPTATGEKQEPPEPEPAALLDSEEENTSKGVFKASCFFQYSSCVGVHMCLEQGHEGVCVCVCILCACTYCCVCQHLCV